MEQLEHVVNAKRTLCEYAEAQYAAAKAHCTLRAHENERLVSQVNAKSQKKPHQNMQPDACLLTAPEAQAAFKLSEYDWLTKEEAAAQKQTEKLTVD